MAQPAQWIDPYPGFVYDVDHIEISAEYQAEKLAACGIPTDAFGAQVDPSFFIGVAIHAGIKSGISAEGNINMLQTLTQFRPVALGERLTVRGQISDVQIVPRGRTLHTEVQFEDADSQVVITADRVSLKPDPDKAGTRGAGDKPPPVVADPERLIRDGVFQLTPEGVKAYSSEGNSIHYEEEAARKAGFRAPLIGGGMGVHFLMAALWRLHPPMSFKANVYFRRPIFWDEALTVAYDARHKPSAMALLKPGGKVGTELGLVDLLLR